MSDFHELIKNFSKCRDYVRDFFVYGFKSRQDFTLEKRSARTYDNERRRIESWLGDYVAEELTGQNTKGRVKNISLQIDSNLLDTNPLFAVWKTKSFTDHDILLHFFLTDILKNRKCSANELAEILSQNYELALDTQLVRRKCNEYVKEGLFITEKSGKTVLYQLSESWEKFCSDTALSEALSDAVSFLQLCAPFGYVGNTITSRRNFSNSGFRIKHSFPAFTLEDEIAFALLSAKENHHFIKMEIQSNRRIGMMSISGVPLKIFVSSRTGRILDIRFYSIDEKFQLRAKNKNLREDFCYDLEALYQTYLF